MCQGQPWFYFAAAGEAIAIHGMSRVALYHSPALLGQAAVFAHYLPECDSRLHTGEWGLSLTGANVWRCANASMEPCMELQAGCLSKKMMES